MTRAAGGGACPARLLPQLASEVSEAPDRQRRRPAEGDAKRHRPLRLGEAAADHTGRAEHRGALLDQQAGPRPFGDGNEYPLLSRLGARDARRRGPVYVRQATVVDLTTVLAGEVHQRDARPGVGAKCRASGYHRVCWDDDETHLLADRRRTRRWGAPRSK